MDGDIEIRVVDFGQMAPAIGSVEGDRNCLANADLDTESEVNLIVDVVLSSDLGDAGDG